MKREALLSIVISCISLQASSQGYIDIDTNIQMGMVNSEHVKITSSAFNIHSNDPTQPLIFGDFRNGNVGIGTDSPDVKLTVFRDSPGVISRFASSSVGLIGLRIQGEAAGGTALVGGDYQGENTLADSMLQNVKERFPNPSKLEGSWIDLQNNCQRMLEKPKLNQIKSDFKFS